MLCTQRPHECGDPRVARSFAATMPPAKIMLRYLPVGVDPDAVMGAVHRALDAKQIRANLVYFEEGKIR